MGPKADQIGMLFHLAARGPDGLVVVNLWDSEEASEKAAQDPEIDQARQAMRDSGTATGPPEFEHYVVNDYRPVSGA